MSAPITIAGVVLDILTNQPIPGVHVFTRAPGGVVGTTTDPEGLYALDVQPGALVELSHVSYTGEAFTASDAAPGSVHYLERRAYDIPEVEIFPDPPLEPVAKVSAWVFGGLLVAIAALRAMRGQ